MSLEFQENLSEQKNADDNMDKLMKELSNKPIRDAQFKTVIALNFKGKQHLFVGIASGKITSEKMGTSGFGYDPIFQPYGFDRTSAQLTAEEKDAISHRGQALRSFVPVLMDMLLPARGCGAGCKCAGA